MILYGFRKHTNLIWCKFLSYILNDVHNLAMSLPTVCFVNSSISTLIQFVEAYVLTGIFTTIYIVFMWSLVVHSFHNSHAHTIHGLHRADYTKQICYGEAKKVHDLLNFCHTMTYIWFYCKPNYSPPLAAAWPVPIWIDDCSVGLFILRQVRERPKNCFLYLSYMCSN